MGKMWLIQESKYLLPIFSLHVRTSRGSDQAQGSPPQLIHSLWTFGLYCLPELAEMLNLFNKGQLQFEDLPDIDLVINWIINWAGSAKCCCGGPKISPLGVENWRWAEPQRTQLKIFKVMFIVSVWTPELNYLFFSRASCLLTELLSACLPFLYS